MEIKEKHIKYTKFMKITFFNQYPIMRMITFICLHLWQYFCDNENDDNGNNDDDDDYYFLIN